MTAAVSHPVPIVVGTDTWRGRALVPVLVYIGLLVAIVSSLGAPLIPTIATDYGVSLGTAQWSLTITLLVGAVTSPMVGRLGDGPRRLHVLLACLAILVGGSVLAALPIHSFALLLIGRAMQGIGLALIPLAMGIARDHLAPERARTALATLSVTAVVGVGAGYPLTGLIAEHLSFKAGFWLAAALGVIAIVSSALVVPASIHRPTQSFDLAGAIMLAAGLGTLLLAISESEEWGWSSATLWILAFAALAIMIVWGWHEMRTHSPLVDLRLMRNRSVLIANVSGILAGVGMYMLMSMVIRYVQTPASTGYGLGASVVVGGLVLLPMSVLSYLSSRVSSSLSSRISPERILPVGILAFAAGLVLFALARTQLWESFVVMGVAGLGMGCSFAVMPRLIVTSVPSEKTSSALALNQVLRTVGYSIGSALAATILTAHTTSLSEFPRNSGYTVGALVAIAMCVLTAILAAVLGGRRSSARLSDDEALQIEESTDAAISSTIAFEPTESQDRVDATARR